MKFTEREVEPHGKQGDEDLTSRWSVLGRAVAGERGTPAIARTLSLQARLSNLLAVSLIILVTGGLLVWYYTHQLTSRRRVQQNAQHTATARAAAEMVLPPLGPIETPSALALLASHLADASSPMPATDPGAVAATARAASSASAQPPLPAAPLATVLSPAPPAAADHLPAAAGVLLPTSAVTAATGGSQPTTLQRRLAGEAFVAASGTGLPDAAAGAPGSQAQSEQPPSAPTGAATPTAMVGPDAPAQPQPRPIRLSWQGAAVAGAAPYVLADQSLLLPKGTFIDCTLETAIDSTLPGMTSCITATDTFGADGRVVLLERGTRLVGETEGQVQQASARVFVLWSEARTPLGVVVPLESPGADELGRSGLPGSVDRHFWERFGAAIMISTIDGAVQAAVQSSAQNGGTVIYQPGASQDVMTEVLKSTVNIPPTVLKRNGDRIQVLVAHDVDFRQVYELQHAAH